MNDGFTKGACPAPTHIINIEFQSKDGLVGYQDNYILPPFNRKRIVRSCASPVTAYAAYDLETYYNNMQTPFPTRTYEDTGRHCHVCGRRIFAEV